jgi:hypothetical protein
MRRAFIILIIAGGTAILEHSDCYARPQEKKLIYFGWDVKGPADLVKDIDGLQELPFDGQVVRSNFSYTFSMTDLKDAAAENEMALMKNVKWGRYTDNLMYMVADTCVDWFDDSLFEKEGYIIRNVRNLTRIARAGGCKGIYFEPEFVYWGHPHPAWKYPVQGRAGEKSFAEFEVMVRQRGAQIMDCIELEMPAPIILTSFWTTIDVIADAAKKPDMDSARERLQNEYYGLLHAFMLGMLEAADKETFIIDGNEFAYYSVTPEAFYTGNRLIRENILFLIPDELKYKYRAQVLVGHPIYADLFCNTRGIHMISTYQTPQQRADALESNVYWAMKASDKYTWFYSEKPLFLRNQRVAPEICPAIARAVENIAQGAGPTKLIKDILAERDQAYAEWHKHEYAAVEPRETHIIRVAAAPAIDGKLDDDAWQSAKPLSAFQACLTASEKLETATTTWMTYDPKYLYVAFRCEDPEMDLLSAAKWDDAELFWPGDTVEVAVAAGLDDPNYYHIRVTSNNDVWDSVTESAVYPREISGKDSSWTSSCRNAVHVDPDNGFWSAEMAIAWEAVNKAAPKPGDTLKGNLRRRTHRRHTHASNEFSSWSQVRRSRHVEAENFGSWVFE